MKKTCKSLLALLLSMLLLLTGCTVEISTGSDTASNGSGFSVNISDEPTGSADIGSASALPDETPDIQDIQSDTDDDIPAEDGTYTSKDEVAAYLHAYGHLPSNFITKKEAQARGWVSSKRNLAEAAPGMSIGGDHFGNYEGILPDGNYHECDIDSTDGNRGAKRIVYSDDGRSYYTGDHYQTFELLYGEEAS